MFYNKSKKEKHVYRINVATTHMIWKLYRFQFGLKWLVNKKILENDPEFLYFGGLMSWKIMNLPLLL